ncbi:MAG: class I SAM-dependent methyltransferase [Propionibacteriaceae bacterium]|jgi:demethylmenaquinone methyltransferase/2-methoxy-6-polyprenyl-1,4-benzoquinol methylase|nr:class I SAM-dependent methyltransferase [Propionibacteriaceae bacterium]
MFDAVARRYDRMNSLASLGQDRRWRAALVGALEPRSGELMLDLAAGTGASARPLERAGARVVAVDLSFGMVQWGRRHHRRLPFVQGDALALPFADQTFDAATCSFGLRNMVDPVAALGELRRVVRPDGSLVVCEFSKPVNALWRRLYEGWLRRAMPKLAALASSDPAAYVYLTESILDWPDQAGVAEMISQAGWSAVEWRNLTGGVVALHRARRG